MPRVLLVALLLTTGCRKASREEQCDQFVKMGMQVAEEVGKQLGAKDMKLGADPEIKAKMAELKAQCMTWPEEVFECMRANDETSPKCRDAMSHVTGVVETDTSHLPDGPEIVATAKLGEVDSDGLATSLSPDGTLVAARKSWVAAFDASGKERWRQEIANAGWLVTLGDGSVLVGGREDEEIVAFDAKTGAARWRVSIPDDDSASMEAAVRVGERAIVALSDGRLLRVDPATCAKKKTGCLELAFALETESFYDPELLAVGEDIVIAEADLIRRFTLDGKLRAAIAVRDTLGGVSLLDGTRIAASMDDELVLWDLAKCPASPVVLSRKKGRMYIKGDGDCEGCTAPPAGCLVKRVELDDVESSRPVVLKDGSVMVSNLDGPALVSPGGAKRWVASIDSVGPVRQVGSTVVFVSRDESENKPARLVALDIATGKAKWKRVLDGDSDLSYTTQAFVETAGPWLVAGSKGNVSWLEP